MNKHQSVGMATLCVAVAMWLSSMGGMWWIRQAVTRAPVVIAQEVRSKMADPAPPGYQEYVDDWFTLAANGNKRHVVVRTVKDTGESDEDWAARHQSAVAKREALSPPCP